MKHWRKPIQRMRLIPYLPKPRLHIGDVVDGRRVVAIKKDGRTYRYTLSDEQTKIDHACRN